MHYDLETTQTELAERKQRKFSISYPETARGHTTPSRAPPGIKLMLYGGREAAHLRGIHAEGSVDARAEGVEGGEGGGGGKVSFFFAPIVLKEE